MSLGAFTALAEYNFSSGLSSLGSCLEALPKDTPPVQISDSMLRVFKEIGEAWVAMNKPLMQISPVVQIPDSMITAINALKEAGLKVAMNNPPIQIPLMQIDIPPVKISYYIIAAIEGLKEAGSVSGSYFAFSPHLL